MQDQDYLTTAEVCAYLRLKERTVYDLVARRAIPCSRATGKLLFPRRLVDRWVEAHVTMADASPAEPPPIIAGSSDPLLEWALRESGSGLAILFEGSEAGLRRLAAGEAAACGLHLREPDDSYNVQPVRLLATVSDIVLLQWAWREQGLVVARRNPLAISGVADLARAEIRFVRRQPGSGSDALLAILATKAGVPMEAIHATGRLALTDADVAATVADGGADCGLAIGAVARRFGLDFVPLTRERFDLALRRRTFFEPAIQKLFAFARTDVFAQRAAALGGYDVRSIGAVELNS